MPGKFTAFWQAFEYAAYLSGRSWRSCQTGNITVGGDFTGGNSGKNLVDALLKSIEVIHKFSLIRSQQ
jgi:hypothetical protein